MTEDDLFEIKFADKGIRPDTIRASDLAKVLEAVDQSVSSIAEGISKGDFRHNPFVSLVEIRSGCAALVFESHSPAFTNPAVAYFTESIRLGAESRLPQKAREGLKTLREFNAAYNCRSELRLHRSDKEPAAVIPAPKELTIPPTGNITGETEIYATVVGVRGERKFKVELRLESGEKIDADATRKLLKELGCFVLETIGLRGEATWDIENGSIVAFKIIEILSYRDGDVTEAFAHLRKEFGECFDDIEDVDHFVSSLRGD